MFVAILQRLHHSGKCFSSVSGKTLMCVLLPHSGHRRNPLVFTVMVNLLFVLWQARGDFNPDPLLQEREKHAVPATCHYEMEMYPVRTGCADSRDRTDTLLVGGDIPTRRTACCAISAC